MTSSTVSEPIRYDGPESDNPFAFRWYDADRVVSGRSMADHLRFGVCYWHSFAWDGSDIFGAGTLDRPWNPATGISKAAGRRWLPRVEDGCRVRVRLEVGGSVLLVPRRRHRAGGWVVRRDGRNLDEMVDEAAGHMERTGVKLLWGTTNAFCTPGSCRVRRPTRIRLCSIRGGAGGALHVDDDRLGGANYVLWGGREGYETLLNTDMSRELDQLGRFMNMVVEHKYAIGFDGTLLIEPKPMEPTKHQYDYDVATVYAFLQKYGLEDEIKVNIEVNHATLSGHDFHHEVATAVNAGIFGSIDANAGDDRLGWDLDLFPKSVEQMTLGMLEILRGGGFTTGGLMFDTKLRRQSIARDDLFIGHIAAMDTMARSLLAAASIIEHGELDGVATSATPAGTTGRTSSTARSPCSNSTTT